MGSINSIPQTRSKDRVVLNHADRILETHQELKDIRKDISQRVKDIIQTVFADETIGKNFEGAKIRWTAMCGEVAHDILTVLGDPADEYIKLMSIGDVDLPDFARKVAGQIITKSHRYHKKIIQEEGYGYDLASKGSESARTSMIEYFDKHYGFSEVPGLKEKLILNSSITAGGMSALDDIASAMVNSAVNENTPAKPKKQRFIQPDNSFATWYTIVNLRSNIKNSSKWIDDQKNATAESHKIPTEPKDLLHLTPAKVDEFYAKNPVDEIHNDSWPITPVGNPSGTYYVDGQVLTETCQQIIKHNPNAIIILDCTYVRTLKPEVAKNLMSGLIQNPAILNRLIFVESFSKTHGFSGERIGTFFSANAEIYSTVQNINMKVKAGNGIYKSALVLALTNLNQKQKGKLEKLHEFWARERQGLYNYLVKSGKFNHLFEEEQFHITSEQLSEPLGLYIFLKLKPGVDGQKVLLDTRCLGVETNEEDFESGNYMRFSVGKIKEPTYAKYA